MNKITCKRCKSTETSIQQAEDGYHKEVKCYACGWTIPLRNLNKKTPHKN
jgi:translation initiation factor 2 beta subunit (eIF-2beta)/eIF-5